MNGTRIGILAFVTASALFAGAMYTMLSRDDRDSSDLDGSSLPELFNDSDIGSLLSVEPRTVREETTTVTAIGETTVTRTNRYEAGSTTRIDTLDNGGRVTTTRISDFGGGVIECDWAAGICRTIVASRPATARDISRPPRTRTPGPSPTPFDIRTALAGRPTARVTTSERTILGEAVTCTSTDMPGSQRDVCKTSDGITLYTRTANDSTTTTTVATDLARFIPYEAIGLPFPLEGEDQ